MKLTLTLLIVFSQFIIVPVYSQEESVRIQTPEAAALSKALEYPVSLYTGIPQISIPLANVKAGKIDYPLTLSYHSGGNKPNEQATWVGLNWSLSAAPEISRIIRGVDDFVVYGYLQNNRVGEYDEYTYPPISGS